MEKEIINLLINGSVPTIIGVAVIVVCYKLLKLFFDNQVESKKAEFQKDIEHYKNELEKEKNAFMIKIEQGKQWFQSELDKKLNEHQIIFNSLNNERFRVCNELFGILVNLMGMGKAYTSIFKTMPLGKTYEEFEKEQLDEFQREYLSFWKLYSPNRLYFEENLSSEIFDLASNLLRNVNELAFKKQFKFEGFGKDKLKAMKENFDNILALEPKMKKIENELRKILGVPKNISN